MPAPLLYFVHGWGYDSSFWRPLCNDLSAFSCDFYEAGYFGHRQATIPPSHPYLAIGHSAGVMTILEQNDPLCQGLIALNGFACFAQSPSFPQGIPARVLQRMSTRLEQSPETTLSQFRSLCGEEYPALPQIYETSRLKAGLEFLQCHDVRPVLPHWNKPLITVTGNRDPLSPALTGLAYPPGFSLFWESHCWEGGHLLPITHVIQSAQLIRRIIRYIDRPSS
ncbi:alpha/beta hydrolase [Acetobacteraceae bacterium ESL0709]|nr:alpha/beta hydrolase [Acetobacteraceae bacterium ESL0697]MDF7677214.1 alpha/beta hydrolase [Acetobacteraceae bacterium ESL0709]